MRSGCQRCLEVGLIQSQWHRDSGNDKGLILHCHNLRSGLIIIALVVKKVCLEMNALLHLWKQLLAYRDRVSAVMTKTRKVRQG